MYITKQEEFEKFIKKVNKSRAVAIDTEFIREKTYWPKLCLLQMAIDDVYALIDPFKVDISSIKRVFENENVMKVFHSPRQDIEILLFKTGVLPTPMFDSQIAASFLGYTSQIGYGNLVYAELDTKLKKGDSYTDWSQRPLSKSQLKYASDDVTYLLQLYYRMSKRLKAEGRMAWVEEDIKEKYLSKEIYDESIDERFWHLKRITSLSSRQLACAKEVAAWREKVAMKRNLPRRWVLSDDQVIEACKRIPKSLEELFTIRGIKGSLNTGDARRVVEAINRGMSYKKEDCPKLSDNQKYQFNDKNSDKFDINAEIDLMNALISLRAKENNIAAQVLTSSSDLTKIAHGHRENIPTLSGWRAELIGNELIELLNGKISLSIKSGKLIVNKN